MWSNVYLDPSSGLSQDLFVMAFFSASLSLGVTAAVGYLLYIQVNRVPDEICGSLIHGYVHIN